MKIKQYLLAVAVAVLSAGSAVALPMLEGNLGLTGTYTSLERFDSSLSTWVAANTLTAERLSFADIDPGTAGVQLLISGSTGSFIGENGLQATIVSPFTFIPSTPYSPLWMTVDGRFKFDLASITETVRSSSFLYVSGTGLITDLTGEHDATVGEWSYSSQAGFTFSANTATVPEGGSTVVLLGAGLLALAGFGVWRNRKAAALAPARIRR